MNKTDEELLAELKSGCIIAYQALFKRYYKLLLTHAYFFLQDEMEAEDIIQSFFIEIWDKQLYNKINSSLKSYLLKAVRNRCLTEIYKRNKLIKEHEKYVKDGEYATNSDFFELKEGNSFVNSILNELPSQRSQAFSMVYLEDMKYKDVAAEMGISVNSVKTHLRLALKNLKTRFTRNQ